MATNLLEDLFQQATAHQNAGRIAEAEQLYRQILSQQPNHAYAMHNLAIVHNIRKSWPEAIKLMSRSLKLDPTPLHFWQNLGITYRLSGQLEEALQTLQELLTRWPNDAFSRHELGLVYDKLGRFPDAIQEYRQALAPLSGSTSENDRMLLSRIYANLGSAHFALKEYEEAQAAALQATCLRPDYALAHMNRADSLFRLKRLTEAWHEYEWRWKREGFTQKWPNFPQPLWDGSDLRGRTILLWHEQGLGDTVQFCRYAPLVAEKGGTTILLCQPALETLLKCLPASVQVVPSGGAGVSFDCHLPLMSLPRIFNTSLETIPFKEGYLTADPLIVDVWRKRIESQLSGNPNALLKVGLVWAGAPTHVNDRKRSIPFEFLTPLLEIPEIQFYSLQKGEAVQQLRQSAQRGRVMDWSDDFTDYAQTAGLIANLDLVLAVDTSVAHVAGALGKSVWTLLPFEPDFRYVYDEEQSSWYAAMKLFRQTAPGDWPELLDRVQQMLWQQIDVR